MRAADATPAGALPRRVCSSNNRSPVMTKRGSLNTSGEVHQIQNQLDARAHAGPQCGECAETDTARRARPWRTRQVNARRVAHQRGPPVQRRIQLRHVPRAGPLLRSVDRRCAVRAERWVVHVGGNDDVRRG